MLNPWLVLGSSAFVASFSISLMMNRDLGGAIAAGAMGLAIAWSSAAAVNWYRNHSTETRIATLKHQIRTLQQHRAAEQQALREWETEKERVMRSLTSIQSDGQQRPAAASPAPAVSWNLAATEVIESSQTYLSPEEMAAGTAQADLRHFLDEAAATKQKITTTLNDLQTELGQLNLQTAENRQFRDQLAQEVNHLSQQKQMLVSTTKRLQADIKELEKGRHELDQYISHAKTKKQELETGANPLQKTLTPLQTQIAALHNELQQLETQVGDRQREKESLDQTIATLHQQTQQVQVAQAALQTVEQKLSDRRKEKETVEKQIVQLQAQKTALRASSLQPDLMTSAKATSPKDPPSKATASKSSSKKLAAPPKPRSLANSIEGETLPESHISGSPQSVLAQESMPEPEQPVEALSDPWTNLMVQLSDYEFQALRAIAQEINPLRTLNAIADESFTSLDELLESINRQAQDIVGEPVVNPRSGFAPPAIVREHQKTIKKMIETYEYLTD